MDMLLIIHVYLVVLMVSMLTIILNYAFNFVLEFHPTMLMIPPTNVLKFAQLSLIILEKR